MLVLLFRTGNYLDGSGAGESASGLTIRAPNTVVRGLVINRFVGATGNGIFALAEASGTRIEGNLLGTDPSGQGDFGNGVGVSVINAVNITVGGSSPEARNLISGNERDGVVLSTYSCCSGNEVQGNLIGTQEDGKSPLRNGDSGVDMFASSGNTVGGTTPAAANVIAFNQGDGVVIRSTTTANSVLRNSIFSSGDLGIDLGGDGATANDPGDADSGPNNLQNKPAISSAKTGSAGTTIRGNLNSKPNQIYVVRFFSNPSGDEGKVFKGQKNVTTGSDGKGSFAFSPAGKVGVGQTVTATATDSAGNTSEFSDPRTVAAL